MIYSPFLGTPDLILSPLLGTSENAGVRQSLLLFSPLLVTPRNAGVAWQFQPLLGPREGRGEAATSDFVPFVGDPREM